jgi:nucleoside-diphosphate-sugar epimerase
MASALFYALKKTNTKLVYADNMYSYGNLNGNEFIETLENKALTKKGIIRSRVVHTLLHDDPAVNKKVAIVKAADFIGNGIHKGIFSSDFIDRLYNNKTISLYGNLHLPHSFTNINDFAKAMINISQSDDAFGQVWHAPNSTTLSISEWITLFELETGRKANIISVPKVIIFLLGIVNKNIKELYELGYQFEYPYLVNNKKYTDKFGMHFTANTQSVKQAVDHYWKNKSK